MSGTHLEGAVEPGDFGHLVLNHFASDRRKVGGLDLG